MSQHQPVLVMGGTRGTGLLIARLLYRQGLSVRVLARDRVRAVTLFDRTVDVVSGDVTNEDTLSLHDFERPHDTVILDDLSESVVGQHSHLASTRRV